MERYINEKIGELPIYRFLKRVGVNDLFWDFDAVSSYPSAMSDEKSIYPSIERSYAFRRDMNDEKVENLIIKPLHREVLL